MIFNDLQEFEGLFVIFFKPFRFNKVLTYITLKRTMMKIFNFNYKGAVFLMVFGLLVAACSSDESTDVNV